MVGVALTAHAETMNARRLLLWELGRVWCEGVWGERGAHRRVEGEFDMTEMVSRLISGDGESVWWMS